MTKKKKAQVIKLDKSTISAKKVGEINTANNTLRTDVDFTVTQVKELSKEISTLDYSGHKYLSDTVIRLQRNANSAIMVTEILLDILKCMAYEERIIIQQLNNEAAETEKAQQEIQKRNGKQ